MVQVTVSKNALNLRVPVVAYEPLRMRRKLVQGKKDYEVRAQSPR